jgi:hypothetical protein
VSIIGGLDLHRAQITYDWIDTDTGQTRQGQLAPASREHLRGWLERFAGQQATFAWRAVPAGGMWLRNSSWPGSPRTWPSRPTPARCGAADATPRPTGLTLATSATCSWGVAARVVDPAGARARGSHPGPAVQGPGRSAHRLAAAHPCGLFRHGVPAESDLLVAERRQRLTRGAGLTLAAQQAVLLALRMIDAIDAELDLLRAELAHLARRRGVPQRPPADHSQDHQRPAVPGPPQDTRHRAAVRLSAAGRARDQDPRVGGVGDRRVRPGLSTRDAEALGPQAALSRSTVSPICAQLAEDDQPVSPRLTPSPAPCPGCRCGSWSAASTSPA